MAARRNSTRITTAATTQVEDNSCVLSLVVVEAQLAGTVTITDDAGSTPTPETLAILPIGFPAGSHLMMIGCKFGLKVVTSTTDRIIVVSDIGGGIP